MKRLIKVSLGAESAGASRFRFGEIVSNGNNKGVADGAGNVILTESGVVGENGFMPLKATDDFIFDILERYTAKIAADEIFPGEEQILEEIKAVQTTLRDAYEHRYGLDMTRQIANIVLCSRFPRELLEDFVTPRELAMYFFTPEFVKSYVIMLENARFS